MSGPSGELGDRPAVRRSLGVAFIGLVLGAVLLTYLVFNDAFSRAVPVTVRTQQAGLDLSAGNDVKVRGVLVGEVESVEANGGSAIIHLALDRDTVAQIPSTVQAVIAPTTLFGQKFVDLQPTNTAVTTPIQRGAVIQAAKLPVEIEAILNDIYPVLEALRPADLSVTINAIAGALDGQGERLGGTIERLSDYLAKLSPLSNQLVDDIVKLGDVADQYADAIPALGSALGDVAVTSNTVVGRRAQLQAVFTNLAGFADTTENFVRQSGDDYIDLVTTGRPTLELLSRYAPTIGCVISGVDTLLPRVADAFRGQRAHVSIQLAPRSASGYTTREAPRQPSLATPDSPTCRSLPASPYNGTRIAPGVPGSVLQQFGIDPQHHKTAAGSTFTGTDETADTTGLSRSMGNVGSVADRQAVDAVVGASTGRAVGDVSGLAALTVGSSLRGSEVSFR